MLYAIVMRRVGGNASFKGSSRIVGFGLRCGGYSKSTLSSSTGFNKTTTASRHLKLVSSKASKRYQGGRNTNSMNHSTTSTLDFTNSVGGLAGSGRSVSGQPSLQSLRTLFVASAIPMVGFGFMDNFVMIQAGQYIDSTIGVQLGLATMTAAAAGQVVSDVSGVVFGGTLERFLTRMKLIQTPNLSIKQRQLPICRNIAMLGAVLGVICGCALGATTLLLVDLEARDRIQHAHQLHEIVNDMIHDQDSASVVPCDSCTVYISSKDYTLDHSNSGKEGEKTVLRSIKEVSADKNHTLVTDCVNQKQTLVSEDRKVLCAPIIKKIDDNNELSDEVVAVITLQTPDDHDGYNNENIATAKVMARHIAIFMERLTE